MYKELIIESISIDLEYLREEMAEYELCADIENPEYKKLQQLEKELLDKKEQLFRELGEE